MNKEIIEIHKSGKFYHTFANDAVIMHHLMGYRIVKEKGGVGFPESALNKVVNTLNNQKISYVIYEKNILVEEKDFKKLNKYKKVLKESLNKLDIEERVNRLEDKIDKLNTEELKKIMELIEDAISNWKIFDC